jgi:hypothetical protein
MAFMYAGPQSAWVNAQHQKRMAAGAETDELESLQLELLRAEVANAKSANMGDAELSKQSGEMAADYLKQWNQGLDAAGGMYNTAIEEIGKAQGMVGDAYKDVSSNLGSMSEDIKSEWESMKTQWGGIQGDLIGSAKEDIANRGQLTRQFMDLAKSDEEGASGRAMADVAAQGEAGRQAEAMRLQGLGIDPASGRARSLMRTSRNQEALSKAMAGNQARLAEKDRVAGLTATGLNLIDPTKSANAASVIQNMSNDLLSARSNLEVNRANVQGNLAGTTANLASQRGNLATGFAQNVVAPKGEMGATQLGVSQGSRPVAGATTGARTNTMEDARAAAKAMRAKFYGT